VLLKMLKLLRRTFCETQSEISYRHGYIGLHTDPLRASIFCLKACSMMCSMKDPQFTTSCVQMTKRRCAAK